MRFSDTLPIPSSEAQAHSEQLVQKIRAAIATNGGKIPFRHFMQMALYEPQLGYYVAGLNKFGAEGDFVTAPEISALFSQCLAQQCAQILAELGGGNILELGAGSGRMAADLLTQLQTIDQLPEHYYILEVSPDLRARQQQTLQTALPDFFERIHWLERLPETPLRGVILGNEVLDAMPVELFSLVDNQRVTRYVQWQDNQFCFDPAPSDYTSEYNPALPAWLASLADSLAAGAIVLIDYGYEAADYYHPDRAQGTLICHYQHRVHDNPLVYVGLQDITASVDFTAVAEAGVEAGLELAGYTTQAAFLASCGLEDLFVQALNNAPERQYALAQQVRTLCLPSEMGERFKVIGFTKAFTSPLDGFRLTDRRHCL